MSPRMKGNETSNQRPGQGPLPAIRGMDDAETASDPRATARREVKVRVTMPNPSCVQFPDERNPSHPEPDHRIGPSVPSKARPGLPITGGLPTAGAALSPLPSAGRKALPAGAKGTAHEHPLPPDGDTPFGNIDLHDLLRQLASLQQDRRDILFLLRSLRQALHNNRVELSPETRRIHREVVRLEPFAGRCPCCLETKLVSEDGALIPPVEFDHFLGPVYSAPVHSWLICRPCHQAL